MKAHLKCLSIGIILIFHLAATRVHSEEASAFSESGPLYRAVSNAGEEQHLIAQFLSDDRDDDGKARKRDTSKDNLGPKPVFVLGLMGALSNQEGFATVSVMSMLGIQYNKFYFTADPVFIYARTKSIKIKNPALRMKSTGEIIQIGLPAKCTYAFLDLASYPYSPYVQVGIGYDFKKYASSGSSLISRTHHTYYVDSLALHYGAGFLLKLTEQTRFQIGLSGTSYFNSNPGIFSYDTTGASMLFGIIVIFD